MGQQELYSDQQSAINIWLKLQCQMANNSPQGLLAKHGAKGGIDKVAHWASTNNKAPANNEVAMKRNASATLSKKRFHLSKSKSGSQLLGFPIKVGSAIWAIVIVVNNNDRFDMLATIKLLQWGATWLQYLLSMPSRAVQPSEPAPADVKPVSTSHLLGVILKEKSVNEMAITTVNFLASRFQVERVSLGLYKDKKVNIEAVSFSAGFDHRTKQMQDIVNAMDETISQRRSIEVFRDEDGASSKQDGVITQAHETILDSHNLSSVHSYLLQAKDEIVGAIVIECNNTDGLGEQTRAFMDKSVPMLSSVFHIQCVSHKSIVAIGKERFLGTLSRVFGKDNTLANVGLTLVVIFFLSLFLPVPFNVSSDAVIDSVDKNLLTAPYEGYIDKIHVRAGDSVSKGDVLVQLQDEDLILEKRKLASELQQYQLEYDSALSSGNRAQASILYSQVEQSRIKLRLLSQKLERTQLVSPIDGIVVSEDADQSSGVPVKQGDVLLRIASGKNYVASLFVNEKDITYITPNQEGELSLTSLPGDDLSIEISRITPVSEVRDGSNYFRVDALIPSPPDGMQPGMSGTAKISIEKRLLGWVLFHDVWNWLRLMW